MRGSAPIPTRTGSISTPRRSARLAISFMKLMRVAIMAMPERAVQRTHEITSALLFRRLTQSNDDPVRPHEVVDRTALFEELRVRDHRKARCWMGTGPALGKHSSHGLCTASPAPTGTVDLLTITLKL